MSDSVIVVENLSKRYILGEAKQKGDGLRHALENAVRNPMGWMKKRANDSAGQSSEFWALKDVSFELKRGEVLGIIGRNGAGKSTLLKLLSRITEPTRGKIELEGRVASLLEVGTGFHPELTGRENIFLNGAILGMARTEIKRKFDEIVAFSEVEKFLDTPVKRYSSGMYVRLAFAVAAHLEPEILIVDEVLAVGDAEFQKKCLGKMKDVALGGRTVLLVSHNMASVKQLCDTALVLEKGTVIQRGPVNECVAAYNRKQESSSPTIVSHAQKVHSGLHLNSIEVNGSSHDVIWIEGDAPELEVIIKGRAELPIRMDLEATVSDTNDLALAFYSPGHEKGATQSINAGDFTLSRKIRLPRRMLTGDYYLNLNLSHHNVAYWANLPQCATLSVQGATSRTGKEFKYADGTGWLLLEDGGNVG